MRAPFKERRMKRRFQPVVVVGSSPTGGARKKHFFGSAFFNEINPFRICEMPFGREILLRNVKYALRRVDLFHFTENFSFLFHNYAVNYFTSTKLIFHL